MSTLEHPFAQFVRILGKGKSGTRSLDFEEARNAFGQILSNQVDPIQLGAFLMLLRVKEESAEELAGFVSASRDQMQTNALPKVDLDWSSYAGKRNQQPWYLLSAILLAENGIRILMHGSSGHTAHRLYGEDALSELGVQAASSGDEATRQIENCGFSYLPLRVICPALDALLQLKPLLGLRSPVNTLVRMLNPARASYSIQSVFHPAYATLHAHTDRLLGQAHSLVIKGDGGEVEIKPQANTRCTMLRDDAIETLEWSRQLPDRPAAVRQLGTAELTQLWASEEDNTTNSYGTLAVTETVACALLLLQRADTPEDARKLARSFWIQRDRNRFTHANK